VTTLPRVAGAQYAPPPLDALADGHPPVAPDTGAPVVAPYPPYPPYASLAVLVEDSLHELDEREAPASSAGQPVFSGPTPGVKSMHPTAPATSDPRASPTAAARIRTSP